MSSLDKSRSESSIYTFSAASLANAHTLTAYAAFSVALVVGSALHFEKITSNEWFRWPQEWMPSVSATIGDRYPERALFQMLIACTMGPRSCVIALWYIMTREAGAKLPLLVCWAGIIRFFSAITWMMVTSGDDHDTHDIAMFAFLIATPLWMGGSLCLSAPGSKARRWRKYALISFWCSVPPMLYLFVQHKIYRIPGAYSRYAYFEWNLIISDIAYDASFVLDFSRLEIRIVRAVDPVSNKSSITRPRRGQDGPQWRDLAAFASDSVLGFCFFTTMTALGPCIFFFNVYNMGMAGQEALLLTNLVVGVIAFRPLRQFVARHGGICHLLSLVGLASYSDDYESHRLACMSVATIIQTITYASLWHKARDQPDILDLQARTLSIGLLATVVTKLANYSLNPAWPFVDARNGGHNRMVIGLAILACVEKHFRPPSPNPHPAVQRRQASRSSVPPIAFGSLLFALHQYASDSGSIIARTWTGFPPTGPLALPHGTMTVLAIATGLVLPFSPVFYPLAVCGAFSLHYRDDWSAFIGGLGLVVFLVSAMQPFLRAVAAQNRPASVFFVVYLVYDLFVLADVWVVAYAFVPGGNLMRERSDLVLGVLLIFLGVGTRHASALHTVASSRFRNMSHCITGLLVATAGVATSYRLQRRPSPVPHFVEDRLMTAGIWTVHFGFDGFMWESQRRMASLIADTNLDVVGLLESDVHRIVFGNRDLTQYIREELGYYVDLGPGPQKHTWGAALLSKFPILNSTHHLLPSPYGELAPAIQATIDVYGIYVEIIVAHNGQEEDIVDRELQSTYLANVMSAAYPRPCIFLGYVVTKPHAPRPAPYRLLIEDGRMLDIDPTDQDRWCEYILFRGLRKVAYARITRGCAYYLTHLPVISETSPANPSVTDTELQTARFLVPTTPVDPDVDITVNNRVSAHDVPLSWRYSPKFLGQGVRGHRFHVLGNGNEALYYA